VWQVWVLDGARRDWTDSGSLPLGYPAPSPLRTIRIIDLGTFCEIIYGAQSVRGKILSRKELAKLSKISTPSNRISDLSDKVKGKRHVETGAVPNWEPLRNLSNENLRLLRRNSTPLSSGDGAVFDGVSRPNFSPRANVRRRVQLAPVADAASSCAGLMSGEVANSCTIDPAQSPYYTALPPKRKLPVTKR
jgi:hypothetical protein